MFPRARRLRSNQDILIVLRRGERVRSGPLTVFYLKGVDSPALVTVIVDKKVSKKAVVRNRFKRQIRAVLEQMPLPTGRLVVRGYQGGEQLEFSEIRTHLERCLRHPRLTSEKLSF